MTKYMVEWEESRTYRAAIEADSEDAALDTIEGTGGDYDPGFLSPIEILSYGYREVTVAKEA